MTGKFTVDQWCVDTVACEISRAGNTYKLSPRAIAVLEQLASRPGDVVTFDEFLSAHWARSVTSPNAVHKVVAELRHALGEDSRYIETIPKRGYRLIAPVVKIEQANGGVPSANEIPRVEPGDLPDDLPDLRTVAESPRTLFTQDANGSAAPQAESLRSEIGVRRSGRWIALGGTVMLIVLAVVVWRDQSSGEQDAVIVDARGRSVVLLSPTVSGGDVTPASFTMIADQVVARLQTSIAATRRQSGGSDHTRNLANADYVVSVHVTADDGAIHADLTFKPSTDDLPLHRERLDAPARDINLLIGKVVAHLSDDLSVLLDPARTKEMREWGTQNVHAYQLARKAASYQVIQNVESLQHAEQFFRQALAHDPHFPYAYESLASTYEAMWKTPTNDAMVEQIRRGLQALSRDAKTAITNQQTIAKVERTYQYVSITTAFDAEAYWSVVIREDPQNIEALNQFSQFLTGAKLLNESDAYLEIAIDLAKSTGRTGLVDAIESGYVTNVGIRGDFERQIALMKKIVDERAPDFTISLLGLVTTLADLGRFREAGIYVARLKGSDAAWGRAAELILAAHRGDIPHGSEGLREALANPDLTNATRGHVCFVVGDIDCGVKYWRSMEQAFVPFHWKFLPDSEVHFATGVVQDARYQALLDQLGMGRKWREHMREAAAKLTPVTGVEVTTPPPLEVTSTSPL